MRGSTLKPPKHETSPCGDGLTVQSHRRFIVSLALSSFAVVSILGAVVIAALLVIVPAFSLENESWNRTDNPITLTNLCLNLTIGFAAIVAARGSNRKRLAIGLVAVSVALGYGLYELGVFDAVG
jgi:hypothetical protein